MAPVDVSSVRPVGRAPEDTAYVTGATPLAMASVVE